MIEIFTDLLWIVVAALLVILFVVLILSVVFLPLCMILIASIFVPIPIYGWIITGVVQLIWLSLT